MSYDMSCDLRLLSSYRDALVSSDERYMVERHLKECADCRRDLQTMVRVGQVIRSMPWEPAPTSIGHEVRRQIAAREAERRQPLRVGGYARAFAPAAAFAGVALSLVLVLRPGVDEPALRLPGPAAVTTEIASAPSEPADSPPAAAQPVAAQPAPVQPAVAQGGPSAPAAERPGNPISDAGRPNAPTSESSGQPDRTVAPNVPSLSSALATPDGAPTMPRPIGRLYGARPSLRDQLGPAVPGSRTVTLLEQSFQGGLAIWRSDTREIYVLRREGGTWSRYQDQAQPSETVAADAPPPGALVPAGGFGALWLTRPEVKSRLGWAVYEPRGSGSTIQAFERGLVVWSPHGLLYVLTDDGRWRTFADASPV